MNPLNRGCRLKRHFALAFLTLFSLALAIAQPHRVHHFFEDIDHEHNHDATEESKDHHSAPAKGPQTECVVQAVIQHCSATSVFVAKIPLIAIATDVYPLVLTRWVYHFSLSPFLQRAPPTQSFFFSS